MFKKDSDQPVNNAQSSAEKLQSLPSLSAVPSRLLFRFAPIPLLDFKDAERQNLAPIVGDCCDLMTSTKTTQEIEFISMSGANEEKGTKLTN